MENKITADINLKPNIDGKDYFKFVYSSDYNSFEEFITSVQEKMILCEDENFGQVVTVVEDWNYIERLPTFHEDFFVEGEKVSVGDFVNYTGDDSEYKTWWTHTEDITCGMEDSYRVSIFYKVGDSLDRGTFEKSIVEGNIYE
jgi:hypothetical protein